MKEDSKATLLKIARDAVECAVTGKPISPAECDDEELNQPRGAFVTIKKRGRLRGCIGQFTADEALCLTVQKMARAAAVEDPRFFNQPIRPDELEELEIEISVLSPLERIDDPMKIELGVHGIYIKRGFQRGCFLPQVATETGWSKEEFLSHCAAGKAGLSPDAWKSPDTELYVFTAEIIKED